MNICIVRSNKFSYSETFLENQLRQIPHKQILYGGWKPMIDLSGDSILPKILNIKFIRGIFSNVLPRLYHKIYTKSLTSLLVANDIDVVLVNYGPTGVSLIEACQATNINMVVHFHGFDATHKKTIQKYKNDYKRLFDTVKGIISVSKDMTNDLINLGASPEKITLIPYGINSSLFVGASPEKADKKAVFVGRFTAKKAPHLTVKAFKKALEKHPDASLVMIGDGELFTQTQEFAKKMGLESKIEFKGVLQPNEIIKELKKARLFVQHSVKTESGDSEGTPNTILEASAMGLPIVSTRHAGIKDAVLENKTGFLVNEHDWENMGDNISILFDDAELAQQMGDRAQRHIKENYELVDQTKYLHSVIIDS